eukprot:3064155-Ditylum_brightwellii.AAC.1
MESTLVCFCNQYCNYQDLAGGDKSENPNTYALAIGAYKAAFYVDMIVVYIFEMMDNNFCTSMYKGIYFNDRLIVFTGYMSRLDLIQWLQRFQVEVNKLVGGTFFQFTIEISNPPDNQQEQLNTAKLNGDDNYLEWLERVELVNTRHFPLFAMKMIRNSKMLEFSVYPKENQQLKYLNKESCHRTTAFKAIPTGVFTRLGQLTSIIPQNCNSPIAELYQQNKKALEQANLPPRRF